jgi:hypothetical protein
MFVPYRRHLQLDDHAAQGFDRANCAYAPVPDKGDRLALPLDQGAAECVLEDRRGIVIVLGAHCHEGVELADRSTPSRCRGLRIDTPGLSSVAPAH